MTTVWTLVVADDAGLVAHVDYWPPPNPHVGGGQKRGTS